jgi:hypothetical protein
MQRIPETKRRGLEAGHSPPSIVEAKNALRFASKIPYASQNDSTVGSGCKDGKNVNMSSEPPLVLR